MRKLFVLLVLCVAATGLKRYRGIEIKPAEKIPAGAYTRPETEAELLAALEEIGTQSRSTSTST